MLVDTDAGAVATLVGRGQRAKLEDLEAALVLGLRDYVRGFAGSPAERVVGVLWEAWIRRWSATLAVAALGTRDRVSVLACHRECLVRAEGIADVREVVAQPREPEAYESFQSTSSYTAFAQTLRPEIGWNDLTADTPKRRISKRAYERRS